MQANSISAWQRRLKAYSKAQGISRVNLAAMLGLKPRALQRRFAGQTEWSLSEYLNAIHLIGLPPIPEPNTLRFRYQNRPGATRFDESAYLTQLEVAAEPLFVGEGRIDVISTDIPMFYLLGCPLALEAKLMVFAGGRQLSQKLTTSFHVRCERLVNRYLEIPRREIWGIDPLRTFTHQLEYLISLNQLTTKQVANIYDELKQFLEKLEADLLDRNINLSLHHDDLRVANTLYRITPLLGTGTSYLSYDNPYAIATADIESDKWFGEHFEHQWTTTNPLSNSREIRAYFTHVNQELARRMKRILGEE